MFGKKKGPPVREAAGAAQWHVAEGGHEGGRLIARFNGAFADSPDRADYPIRIGIALPLTAPNDEGMPDEAEAAQLAAAEEAILATAADRAVLVGVITTGGMREFVLHTDRADWIEAFDRALQEAISTHEVQVMAERDPKWEVYRQFAR